MKLIILKGNLREGLDAISKVPGDSRVTLPILKNFLIEAVDNRIRLSATNLELAITCFLSGKIIEPGGITIPLVILNSIVSNLQAERVNLETEGDNLVVKTDNYEAKIQGVKAEEFPIIPKLSTDEINIQLGNEQLKDALAFVASASQTTGARPELNGVLFDFQLNQLKLVATDSFRLAEKTIPGGQFTAEIRQGFKTIIPLKTVNEIVRAFKEQDEKVSIYFNHNQVLCKTDNLQIISRLTGGEFPNYQAIIPTNSETEVVLNKDELVNALRLTSSFTDRLNEIRIVIKDKAKNIEVYSMSQGLGENRYLIPAKIKGAPLEIVFNWRFLLDGLRGFDGKEISLGLNGDAKAAILRSSGDSSSFYVLMPIKAG